jgi:hypothetical protein
MWFAVLAELLAVMSMVFAVLPLLGLALPTLLLDVARSPALRGAVLRWVLLGIPSVAAWMILVHVGHGAALDIGARKQGGRRDRRRAVRYGLYACGWDVMFGPLGVIVELATKGVSALPEVTKLMVRVPRRSTDAFLRGIYQLSPERASRAQRTGAMAAMALVFVSGGLVITIALCLLCL